VTLIEKAADRMLGMFAPKLTAGACCLDYGRKVTQSCYGGYCTDCYIYHQTCTLNCYCEPEYCGACTKVEACC